MVALAGLFLVLLPLCRYSHADPRCLSGSYSLRDEASRPMALNCERRGILKNPSVISTTHPENFQNCVIDCKNARQSAENACVSFSYNDTTSACTMYGKRLIDQQYRNRTIDYGATYSNPKCYTCDPLACTNLEAVSNGGFENGNGRFADNWYYSFDDGEINRLESTAEQMADSGDYYLNMNPTLGHSGAVDFLQRLDCVNPGLLYTLTVRLKFVGPDSQGLAYVNFDMETVAEIDGCGPTTATECDTWITVERNVVSSSSQPFFQVFYQVYQNKPLLVDSVSIKLAA